MQRPTSRILLVFPLIAATVASVFPPLVHALPPLGRAVHLHPSTSIDNRIRFNLYNSAMSVRDFEIDGKLFRIAAHQTLTVQAVAGTPVRAGDSAPGARSGDVLFVVRPILQDKTRLLY